MIDALNIDTRQLFSIQPPQTSLFFRELITLTPRVLVLGK